MKGILRLILFILSLVPFCIGVLALYQGGIVEDFSRKFMTIFCTIMFSPLIGCIILEAIIFIEKHHKISKL